jgi:hypothetical protein
VAETIRKLIIQWSSLPTKVWTAKISQNSLWEDPQPQAIETASTIRFTALSVGREPKISKIWDLHMLLETTRETLIKAHPVIFTTRTGAM